MAHTPHTNDTIFKSLGADHPQDFLSFFMPGAVFIRQLPTELLRDPLHIDELLLAYASINSEQEIVRHFEEQTREDQTIPERMLLYNRLIKQQVRRIVYSKVVYPFEVETPTPPYVEYGPDGTPIVIFHYEVIKLWEIPAERIWQHSWYGLYPFVPLMQGGATNEGLERASVGIQQIGDRRARSNAMLYLFLLAHRRMPEEAIAAFLRSHPMFEEYVKESPFYQEILREGEERGIKLGEERGIKLGEIHSLREVALRLVKRHYPALEDATRARLESVEDTAQLQRIIDSLDDAQNLEDARVALGLES